MTKPLVHIVNEEFMKPETSTDKREALIIWVEVVELREDPEYEIELFRLCD